MVYGAIYGYFQRGNGNSVYVGMVSGPYSAKSALKNRHNRHLRSTAGLFDKLLKEKGIEFFELRIVEEMKAETQCKLRAILKPRERELIRRLRPSHNTKLCIF
jgi:hypothetical protein